MNIILDLDLDRLKINHAHFSRSYKLEHHVHIGRQDLGLYFHVFNLVDGLNV